MSTKCLTRISFELYLVYSSSFSSGMKIDLLLLRMAINPVNLICQHNQVFKLQNNPESGMTLTNWGKPGSTQFWVYLKFWSMYKHIWALTLIGKYTNISLKNIAICCKHISASAEGKPVLLHLIVKGIDIRFQNNNDLLAPGHINSCTKQSYIWSVYSI